MKVLPKDDERRRLLVHPTGGPFRDQGPADWPDDAYTARRLADGDITIADQVMPQLEAQPEPEPAPPPAPSRSRSRARHDD